MITTKVEKVRGENRVKVTFTCDETNITHIRDVNAVMEDGIYDAKATLARVEEVAQGVQHKINAGIITDQPAAEPVEDVIPVPLGELTMETDNGTT